MRRGLISWSRDEVPAAALEARVCRLQQAMRGAQLDAMLVYTSTVQPSAVSWLTHFVPYSNDGLLVVLPEGRPALFASFSKRVQDWIREVSLIGDLVMTPHLGRGAVGLLRARAGASTRAPHIGLVDREQFPWTVIEPLIEAGWAENLEDGSAVFAGTRQPADEAEAAIAGHAAILVSKAFDAIPPRASLASEVVAAVEAVARGQGAEEVLVKIAPDLALDGVLKRMEGDAALGGRFAVQVSLSYKGVWTRAARSLSQVDMPDAWKSAGRWFEGAITRLSPGNLAAAPSGAPGTVTAWTVEACLGSQPLSLVAYAGVRVAAPTPVPSRALPPGASGVLSAQLDLPDGRWHGASGFIIGAHGAPTRALGRMTA